MIILLKEMVKLMIEKKELESQYGNLSCLDYPEQYNRMDDLTSEIFDMIKSEAPELGGYAQRSLYDVIDDIAFDVMNNNIYLDEVEIRYYSQDDFIEAYVLEGMDEAARNMFDSLFYFMNSDDRIKWVINNYILGEPNYYHDKFLDFVLIIHD